MRPLNLLCMSSSRRRCDRGVELPVDLTGEVALERAADLARGAPLRGALVDVGAGLGVHAHAGDDGHVQGAVNKDCSFLVGTLEGPHTASVGDWIIRGVKGEFYPCKPDIFAATYEAA